MRATRVVMGMALGALAAGCAHHTTNGAATNGAAASSNGASNAEPATPLTSAALAACDARPELAVVSHFPARDWIERFAAAAQIHGIGSYAGDEKWQFESFSVVKLQASPTLTQSLIHI